MDRREQTVIDCAIKAYINIFGEKKWNSLSSKEQYSAIMLICSGLLKEKLN